MTEELFSGDSYTREFGARVVKLEGSPRIKGHSALVR